MIFLPLLYGIKSPAITSTIPTASINLKNWLIVMFGISFIRLMSILTRNATAINIINVNPTRNSQKPIPLTLLNALASLSKNATMAVDPLITSPIMNPRKNNVLRGKVQ
jgi:hypothetical protein